MSTKKDADPHLTRRQAENARAAIKVGGLITRLQQHVDGKIEMSPTAVKASQILLGKVLPDQTRIETEETGPPMSVTEIREQLVQMIASDPTLLEEARKKLEETADNVVEFKEPA